MALGAKKKLLTVDWDSQDLRMALVQSRATGIELLKAVSVPIPKDFSIADAERFGAFLREAIRQSRISNKHAVFCIPREQVVLNTINLPPSPADDLPAMVLNQIARELPFSAEQAVIDFALAAEHDPKEAAKALVAAVRIDDVEFYRKVADEAGLSLERIGLRPYANRLAVMACLPERTSETVLIVEIGPLHTEINVTRGGALVFSRSATATLPDLREGRAENVQDSRIASPGVMDVRASDRSREAVSRLMVEIIRSFEAYRATDATASVGHIVVCGATGLETELAQSLAARFATRAELFAPDRALDLSPARAKELRGFSAVLGLAMGHGRNPLVSFDFLSPKKPVSRRTVRMRKAPRIALTATFVLAAIVASYVKFVNSPKAEAAQAEREVAALQPDKKRIEKLKSLVETVEEWHKTEQYWPEVLVTLTEIFPPPERAQVTRIEFDTELRGTRSKREYISTIDIKLRTAEMTVVNDLTSKLRDLGFENVQAGNETPIRGRNVSVYNFDTSIRADLPRRKSRPAAKPDETPVEEGAADSESEETSNSTAPADTTNKDAKTGEAAGATKVSNDAEAADAPASETAAPVTTKSGEGAAS